MDSGELTKVLLFVVALGASAVFSGAEAAYLSLQRGKLAALKSDEPDKALRIDRLAGNPVKLLSTVLTGNNLANTSAATLATSILLSFLDPNIAVLASTVGVTVLLLVFAEAIPKTIATRYAVDVASIMALPLRIVEFILLPAVWLLERTVKGIAAVMGLPETNIVSQEEIIALLDIGQESGTVPEAQAEMVGQVFRVGSMDLQEIMTHRTKMVGLKKNTTLEEFYRKYVSSPYTQYPVYEDNLDNILGTVALKDVMNGLARGELGPQDDVTALARPAYFLPENRKMGDLFEHLEGIEQSNLFLVDEYGGITGMVTSRQMAQAIVGQIGEEAEQTDVEALVSEQGSVEVDGSTHVDDMNEEFGLDIPEGEYDTLAGYMLSRMGVIPVEGDSISIGEIGLEVKKLSGLRIDRVGITGLMASRPEESKEC